MLGYQPDRRSARPGGAAEKRRDHQTRRRMIYGVCVEWGRISIYRLSHINGMRKDCACNRCRQKCNKKMRRRCGLPDAFCIVRARLPAADKKPPAPLEAELVVRGHLCLPGMGRGSRRCRSEHYRWTRPVPSPAMSLVTSDTVTRLKSPRMECFRQLAATANSSADCLSS